MIKKTAMLSYILALSMFAALSCSTGYAGEKSTYKEPEPYVANFSYTPDAHRVQGSGGVTFTVSSADYITDAKHLWPLAPQFAKFSDAIRDDLSRILTAKGFIVRGPYASYDLIPYSDKKAIDLSLVPTVQIAIAAPTEVYRVQDIRIGISGTVTLKIKEIVTGELLWTKSFPLMAFDISGASGFKSIEWKGLTDVRDVKNDNVKKPILYELGTGNYNEMAQGLEKQYPNLMSTIAGLIDPEEMRILRRQAQEIRKKKGY